MNTALDLRVIESSMATAATGIPGPQAWLEDSYKNSELFWNQLMASSAAIHGHRAHSIVFGKYDFFFDTLSRHGSESALAMVWSDSGEQRAMTFAELASAAHERAESWRSQGAELQQCIAIVESDPRDLAVSIMAAAKIGLIFSIVPPTGSALVKQRLELLAPDYVDSSSLFKLLHSESGIPMLERVTTVSTHGSSRESYSYHSGELVARLFDPSSAALCEPRDVTADQLYLGALRDGGLALGLRPGDAYCAPGFTLLDTQPCLLLAGWLWGACFHDFDLSALEQKDTQDDTRIKETKFRSIGVSTAFRRLCLDKGWRLENCESWWRNPAELAGLSSWQDFITGASLQEVWCSNLKWEPANGGCVLFSSRRKGQFHSGVWPAAGQAWKLMNPSAPDQPSVMEYGLLAPSPVASSFVASDEEEPAPATQNLIVRGRGEFVFGKAMDTVRRGHHYPVEFVIAALEGIGGCEEISIVLTPAFGEGELLRVVVLGFIDAKLLAQMKLEEREIAATIKRRISAQVGNEFLPDRIEFFDYFPRRGEGGTLDHGWCAGQYLAGALHKKAKDPIYRTLSDIRRRVCG